MRASAGGARLVAGSTTLRCALLRAQQRAALRCVSRARLSLTCNPHASLATPTNQPKHRQKKKKESAKGKVESLFERAKELGAEAGSGDVPSTSGGGPFAGEGRTAAGGSAGAGAQAPQAYVIRFYSNGFFTVNDGPGRRVDDPDNHEFMDAIAR